MKKAMVEVSGKMASAFKLPVPAGNEKIFERTHGRITILRPIHIFQAARRCARFKRILERKGYKVYISNPNHSMSMVD